MRYLQATITAMLCLSLAACSIGPLAPVEDAEQAPPRGEARGAPETASGERAPAAAEQAAERTAEQAAAQAPGPARATVPVAIRKSPNDHREYRYLTLDNDLKVLLVADPQTDKAAASLVVFRGSYHEPPEFPGLAHFLEHMLFIGTEKYPEVDAYQAFISQHGGSSNAYTAGDHTNYFFDIKPEQFQAAMDRFAQFFISPLFASEYVDREKNAVHSEYQLQLKADNWRAAAAVGQAMNPDHPESRFTIGSLETLDNGVREALLEFFESSYSADQMALVAVSNESLDELESWVRPMFSAVEDRDLGPAPIDEPLFLDADLPAVVSYQTIKSGYQVTYNFPVPATTQYYRQKPAEYVSNLLGHEGRGSLYQRLQKEGFIESLSAGTNTFDEGNSLLVVEMQLTDRGYRNLEKVTDLLLDYVAILDRNAPQPWRFSEQARIAELGFRFQEQSSASSFVYQVAPRFMRYPPQDVLAAPYLMTDFDPGLISRYVDALTMDNLVMEVAGPDVPAEQRERWFNVPYAISRQAPERAEVADTGLDLPPPNPYLPENLEVLPDDPAGPRLAIARPGLALWSDRDTAFDTPRANIYLSLGIPEGIASARDLAMASLYQRVVEDSLSEEVYPAYLAGLGYRLNVDGYGFELVISGYSDKQRALLATVLKALTGTTIDANRFAVLRDELVRGWRNYRDERPYTQAYGALNYLLLSSRWPPEMLIEALEGVTPADLAEWRDTRTEKFHVLGLDHGNVPVENAWALASTLQDHLPLGAFRREDPKVVEVAAARRFELDIDHQDAAMVLYLQDQDTAITSRAHSALAASILRQAYFSSLRTDQQLGYVVALTNQTLRDRSGLAFIVQSPVASPADLERATQVFLQRQLEAVAAMPEEAFASYKQGLITRLMERDKNLSERGQRLWQNLELGVTSFDLRSQIARAVAGLSKADMLDYLTRTAARFETDRLLVFSKGQFEEAPTRGQALEDVRAFKGTSTAARNGNGVEDEAE